ncbi:MAG: L,D-transpeptidase [Gemmatimonadota bacterium]|nr:L,D-transpeptidase [Gemmatimonadota bacterium]
MRSSINGPRVAVTAAGMLALAGFAGGTGYDFEPDTEGAETARAAVGAAPAAPSARDDESSRATAGERAGLQAEARRLEARLRARVPRGGYIVVDRAENRLYLRRGDEVRVDALVSTGSGAVLREADGARRTWVFDTPAGRRSVLGKRSDPVWVKPDWAFLEEGRPIPSDWTERREAGVLGEFALDLGDGYLIHGTLYERLLGRSVTHGCIRVGRDDLRVLHRESRIGTPVFIF